MKLEDDFVRALVHLARRNRKEGATRLLDVLLELRRYGLTVRAVDTSACNRELTTRDETRRANALRKASVLAREFDLVLEHQPDPRGATFFVRPKRGPLGCRGWVLA